MKKERAEHKRMQQEMKAQSENVLQEEKKLAALERKKSNLRESKLKEELKVVKEKALKAKMGNLLGNKMAGLKMKKNSLIRKFASKWKKKSDLNKALSKVEKTLLAEREAAEAKALAHKKLQLKLTKLEKEVSESKKLIAKKETEYKEKLETLEKSHQEKITIMEKQAAELKVLAEEAEGKKGSLESETKVMVKRLVDKVEAKNDLLHRARIRVAKLEAERNVLKKKLEQYRSREAMIAEEAATEAERQVIALTKLRKQVEEDSEHMDNLNALQRSFDPDILVMTHKKKLMQEQQMQYLNSVQQQQQQQQRQSPSPTLDMPQRPIIDTYSSPAGKMFDTFLDATNEVRNNINRADTFDIFSGVPRGMPNSPSQQIQHQQKMQQIQNLKQQLEQLQQQGISSSSSRRNSPTASFETKLDNFNTNNNNNNNNSNNGSMENNINNVYPTQRQQEGHEKMAYLNRLQMEVQNARKEVDAAKEAIRIQNARYSNLRPENNFKKLSMGDRLLQHRMEVPMEGIFNNTDVNRLPSRHGGQTKIASSVSKNRVHITRQGSVYIDTDDNI